MKVHEKPSRDLGAQLGTVLAPEGNSRPFQKGMWGKLEDVRENRPGWKELDVGEGRDGRVLGTSACGLGTGTVVERAGPWHSFLVAGPKLQG